MRWIAFHFGVPGICAFLAMMLLGGSRPEAVRPVRPAARQVSAVVDPGRPTAEFLGNVAVSANLPPVDDELLHPALPEPAHTVRRRVVMMEVTAYCPCKKCCGARAAGITASGLRVSHNSGHFVAADRAIPFHTKFIIPGYAGGQPVPVLDRGGAIKGNKLDVFFPTHEQAMKWGRRRVAVTIVE